MNTKSQGIKNFVLGISAALLVVYLVACSSAANSKESTQVNDQQQVYLNSQPAPFFDWSLERHMMTELYVARNNAVATFSLTWDPYRGKISWSCPSIGYPIPGGTQLTNPESYVYSGTTLPQAEPNGLYTPATSAGTYVMCVNSDGTVSPVYVEDNVRTFPQPMQEVDGQLVPVPNTVPSLKIDTTQPAK
ncbi:MAG TPA: hypothetical protein VLI92_01535 [Candidatus Saccharimonadales bacterium]|nr:hypothetical protein [Candidatus Saccharimonadales bacterium]